MIFGLLSKDCMNEFINLLLFNYGPLLLLQQLLSLCHSILLLHDVPLELLSTTIILVVDVLNRVFCAVWIYVSVFIMGEHVQTVWNLDLWKLLSIWSLVFNISDQQL